MAQEATTSFPARRGTIITVTDGTHTHVVVHGDIDPKIVNASFDVVWAKDSTGNYLPTARKGDQTGPSSIDLSGIKVFHAGDHPSDAAAIDIAFNTGWYNTNWTSTESGSDFKNLTITVLLPQNVSGTKYSTWTLTDAFVPSDGVGFTVTSGKVSIDNLKFLSAAEWTVVDTP